MSHSRPGNSGNNAKLDNDVVGAMLRAMSTELPKNYRVSEGQKPNPKFSEKGHERTPAIPTGKKAADENAGKEDAKTE